MLIANSIFENALLLWAEYDWLRNNYLFTIYSIDGGISKNDFVVQMIADLTNRPIERRLSSEMSSLGVALMAGIHVGIWKTADLQGLKKVDKLFNPRNNGESARVLVRYKLWNKACSRFINWHDIEDEILR